MVDTRIGGIMAVEGECQMGQRYGQQFKQQAIALTKAPDASVRSVARSLGIRAQTLEYWIKHPPGGTSGYSQAQESDDPVALKLRLREAEARIRRLEMEQEILKKATAFFARENL
jgi:transposase-like protein